MANMLKTEAIRILGGTPSAAADAIGITPQAVNDWPDELTRKIEDRVLAALYRKERLHQGASRGVLRQTRQKKVA